MKIPFFSSSLLQIDKEGADYDDDDDDDETLL